MPDLSSFNRTSDLEKDMKKHKSLSQGIGLLQRLNVYRSVARDGTQFDTRFLRLENRCTLVAAFLIFTAVLSSVLWYALTKVTKTIEVTSPSISTYESILDSTQGKLIGRMSCTCSQTVLPFGTAQGGFVNAASFTLDSICDGYNRTIDSTEEALERLQPLSKGPGPEVPFVFGCPNLQKLNRNAGHVRSRNQSLTYHSDCATTQSIGHGMLEDLNKLCTTAALSNQIVVDAWLHESFGTPIMMQEDDLTKFVTSALDKLAAEQGLRLYISTEPEKIVSIAKAQSETEFRSAVEVGNQFQASCDKFQIGPSEVVDWSGHWDMQLLDGVLECATQNQGTNTIPTFTARCCNATLKTCDPDVILPCSAAMVELGTRMAGTTYATVTGAVLGAFLYGNSQSDRSERNEANGLKPTPKPPPAPAPGQAPAPAASAAAPLKGISSGGGKPRGQAAVNAATGGGTTGNAATGGATTGGAATGGATSGGAATGGATSGGTTSGGATGSAASGGATSGQAATGGAASGGTTSGGAETGGDASAGSTSGGTATGGTAKGGGRRLSATPRRLALNGGYYMPQTVNNTRVEVFRRYYEACNPTECSYVLQDYPGVSGLYLIISGLIGGIISVGKGAGFSFLLASKALIKFRSKEKVQPGEEESQVDF